MKKQDFLVDSGVIQHTHTTHGTKRKKWDTALSALKIVFRKLN